MKKLLCSLIVFVIAAMSVMCVSAASPAGRYFEQNGGNYWCNVDSDGCWITGENGEKEYIMFWSEASRDKIMGEGSNAPLGINPGKDKLPLLPNPTPMPADKPSKGGDPVKCGDIADQTACINAGCHWYIPKPIDGEVPDPFCEINDLCDWLWINQTECEALGCRWDEHNYCASK